MKQTRIVNTAILSLLLIASTGFAYAQHGDNGKGNDRQENQGRQAKPSGGHSGQAQQHGQPQQRMQQQQRPQQQEHAQPQQRMRQQQGPQQHRDARPQQGARQQRMRQDQRRNDWQQHRASNFESQHRTWSQRGGYHGDRVPEANFRRSFGRNHSFRIFGLPYMEYGGRPRFQYGGYWFNMMDPYPEYWGADWYQNDDMYVDYNDGGYYLYNRRFPRRPGLAISLSF